MKAQSLSVSTIVIIVIAVVVLAAVLIFFFTSIGGTNPAMNGQVDTARCQTIISQIQGNNPASPSDVVSLASKLGYCTANCNKVIEPKIQTQSGVCTLTCNSGSPSCT